jgi:hypothetical protein
MRSRHCDTESRRTSSPVRAARRLNWRSGLVDVLAPGQFRQFLTAMRRQDNSRQSGPESFQARGERCSPYPPRWRRDGICGRDRVFLVQYVQVVCEELSGTTRLPNGMGVNLSELPSLWRQRMVRRWIPIGQCGMRAPTHPKRVRLYAIDYGTWEGYASSAKRGPVSQKPYNPVILPSADPAKPLLELIPSPNGTNPLDLHAPPVWHLCR